MKEISASDINKLVKHGYIRNTDTGYVDVKTNTQCGIYRTKTKRYIEDKYINILKRLG